MDLMSPKCGRWRLKCLELVLGGLLMCFFDQALADDHSHPTGLALQYRDLSVRPQDDLYGYVSGQWLKSAKLPEDQARYGSFDELREKSEQDIRALIEGLPQDIPLKPDTPAAKIAALYRSFMVTDAIEALDRKPLMDAFEAIDAVNSDTALVTLLGDYQLMGINTPVGLGIEQDGKNSSRYLVHLMQAGLGLPDRDYYLKKDDARMQAVLSAYRAHIENCFKLLGLGDEGPRADAIIAFETALAKAQWPRVDLRDPKKTYNLLPIETLQRMAPNYAFLALLKQSGVPESALGEVVVMTPSFFEKTDALMRDTPLSVWKDYLKWHVAKFMMPYLSERFVQADFDFYGKTLRGIPQNKPRWKRGVALVESALGEALGKLYVEAYFPQTAKDRMDGLVAHLLQAYRKSIDDLAWMSAPTRQAAQEKLSKLTVKIGYPSHWRDYSALDLDAQDLVGNVIRARIFDSKREIARLGQPVDRTEWHMTPQTVNAYYNPAMNEIVFPAAILQPPFFNAQADDAVNYGGIGAVIGHEISHGFDDMGSQYDGDGNLRDWFQPEDHDKFKAKTERLVAQYERYESVPGYHVNGKLTLGENIADNSGLAIAYKAYQLSLKGKPAPEMEGMTGLQRFYMGWAQVWRSKVRESEAIRLIKVDPHAPAGVRGNAPLVNQAGFYDAFGVVPGDRLYLSPTERVTIW